MPALYIKGLSKKNKDMQKLAVQNKEQIKKAIRTYLRSSPEARFIHRLHALLLLMENEHSNCANIGKLFDNSPRSIASWVHKVNRTGDIEALRDKEKTGRKSRLTDRQIEKIDKAFRQPPAKAGLNIKKWSGEALSGYIKREFGIVLNVRQCQRLIQKLEHDLRGNSKL
jgi:transposase